MEVLRVLRPARGQNGREHIGGGIVLGMAPSVSSLELQIIGQVTLHLRLQSVIDGLAQGLVRGDFVS